MRRSLTIALIFSHFLLGSSKFTHAQEPETPRDVSRGVYRADHIGIEYRLVPYRGHFAAVIESPPVPGSPATKVDIDGKPHTLEPGDWIVTLDEQVIDGPADVDNHVGETTITIKDVKEDVRTGKLIRAKFTLPEGRDGNGGTLAASRRVRSLIISDTASGLMGLKVNVEKIRAMLEPLRKRNLCSIETLEGSRVNQGNIMAWLNSLRDVSNETIFIYYCGHGATDVEADPHPEMRTFGHYLALTNDRELFRSTIRHKLAQLNPRLTILLTECCSNVSKVIGLAPVPEMDLRLARSLFLETRGVIDITGATYDPVTKIGESAWTESSGGFFTQELANALIGAEFQDLDTNPKDGLVTWSEVFPIVREATNDHYKGVREAVLENPPRDMKPRTLAALRDQPEQRPQPFSLERP
jgi:hypothetical protein